MNTPDLTALAVFISLWIAYSWITDRARLFDRVSLTRAMSSQRAVWIRNAMHRDLRMIDTQIMAGLQNGTAFFASTSLLALGSCFALLGATEQVFAIFRGVNGVPGLSSLYEDSDLSVADLNDRAHDQVKDGISATGVADAEDQVRRLAGELKAADAD